MELHETLTQALADLLALRRDPIALINLALEIAHHHDKTSPAAAGAAIAIIAEIAVTKLEDDPFSDDERDWKDIMVVVEQYFSRHAQPLN